MPLAHKFNQALYSYKDVPALFPGWAKGDPQILSVAERFHRVVALRDYIIKSTRKIHGAARETAVITDFKEQVALGKSYFLSLDYSPEFNRIMRGVAVTAADKIYFSFVTEVAAMEWVGMTELEKVESGREIIKTFFRAAEEKFGMKFKTPDLSLYRSAHSHGAGWVYGGRDITGSGRYRSVHMSEAYTGRATFADFMKTVIHECIHHVMIQMTSQIARGRIRWPQLLRDDLDLLLERTRIEANCPTAILDLYRNDPFERIAYDLSELAERRLSQTAEYVRIRSAEVDARRSRPIPQQAVPA